MVFFIVCKQFSAFQARSENGAPKGLYLPAHNKDYAFKFYSREAADAVLKRWGEDYKFEGRVIDNAEADEQEAFFA